MCGISFALDRGSALDAARLVARMHATIPHRGPDGEGFLAGLQRFDRIEEMPGGAHVAAAFRRLNILDVTDAASQPMLSAGRPIAILFNGEIYNFRELRHELAAQGRAFHSSGDTEVALAAYERWGSGCFERLEGMWAIVIVDGERRSVIASRDRFGIKPLYWHAAGRRLLLASEARQIVAATGEARPNDALIAMYLRGVRQPSLDETFFAGIRSVPPATWCEVPFEGEAIAPLQFQRYWDLSRFTANGGPPYAQAVDTFERLLIGAVESHRVSDVPVGALLSGGLDSSTLAAMLSHSLPHVPTFSFAMPAAPELSETRYIEAVARARELPNAQTTIDAPWVRDNAPRVIRALEEPLIGIPPLAQYRVLELCRERGMTVVVDGQGADEILAGYPYHQSAFLRDRWSARRFGALAREARAITGGTSAALALIARDFAGPAIVSRFRRNGAETATWLDPTWGQRDDVSEFTAAMRDRGSDASAVNRQIHFDIRWGNAKTILSFGDKNGMAHALEVRVPFFDRRLVEYSLTLPDTFKIGNGERKRVLRDVARRWLPADVTERRDRIGFGLPQERWVRELWPSIRPVVSDDSFLGRDAFHRAAIRRFLDDFDAGRSSDSASIWRLYSLAIWEKEFRVTT